MDLLGDEGLICPQEGVKPPFYRLVRMEVLSLVFFGDVGRGLDEVDRVIDCRYSNRESLTCIHKRCIDYTSKTCIDYTSNKEVCIYNEGQADQCAVVDGGC